MSDVDKTARRHPAAFKLRSSIEQVAWPVLQRGRAAELMSLQRQFDATQWWSPERLRAAQLRQLSILVEHAYRTVPFYKDRLSRAGYRPEDGLDYKTWDRIPVLTREEVRDLGSELNATSIQPAFGLTAEATSGGSSGVPVRVRKTAVDQLMFEACTIRHALWHCEDVSVTKVSLRKPTVTKNMVMRSGGYLATDWGSTLRHLWRTGRSGFIDSKLPMDSIIDFLVDVKPTIIHCLPSTLRLLLHHCIEQNIDLPFIKSVWTQSEVVDQSLRDSCIKAFGCRIIETYSAAEVGFIAIQCPGGDQYHSMAETLKFEVLDKTGMHCAPGEIGNVVVTPLHNFITPLLRYDVGDEAILGERCSCGRGLPLIQRIIGRSSDYVTLRDGTTRRVSIDNYSLSSIRAIREFQLAQVAIDKLELRLVVTRQLTGTEIQTARNCVSNRMGQEFEVAIRCVDTLPRTTAGKLRMFVSELNVQLSRESSPSATITTSVHSERK